ncbi:MAG: hypothetical protein GX358_03065 [candidate division WS1 bacterium]|nr:hypothetical protein [candidate division WS1 bacterium]
MPHLCAPGQMTFRTTSHIAIYIEELSKTPPAAPVASHMFRNTNAVEAPFRADMHLLTAGKFRLMERQNRPRCDKAHVLLLPPGRRCIHGRARLHIDRHNEGLNCGFADGHARWLRGLNVPDSYNSGDAANYPQTAS